MRPMPMKTVLLATILALLAGSPRVRADEDKRLLLWQLSMAAEIQPVQREAIQDLIAAGIARRGREVLTDRDVVKMLKYEETKLRCGSDVSCLAEIGAALGVPEIVSGSVARIGQTWVLGLQRIDVRHARVLGRCARRFEGPVDALLDQVPAALAELFDHRPGTGAAPAVETGPSYPANPYKLWGHASFWPGLALVGGSVATGVLARKAKDDANGAASPKALAAAEDRMDTYNGLTVAGAVLGGALVVTGAVLWILSPGDEAWARGHGLAIAPVAHAHGAGLVARWSF